MKSNSYMTRALQAHDPRYARVLGKLGYERTDVQAASAGERSGAPAGSQDELTLARADYHAAFGKRPFHAWGVDELRAKIAAHKAG